MAESLPSRILWSTVSMLESPPLKSGTTGAAFHSRTETDYVTCCVSCDWSGSSDDVHSGTSGENEEAAQQELSRPSDKRLGTSASWEKQTDDCLTLQTRYNFFYRRKRAVKKSPTKDFTGKAYTASNHDDDSSGSDITPSD